MENRLVADPGIKWHCRQMVRLGHLLSTETSHGHLMETVVLAAKELTNADGAALCRLDPSSRALRLEIVRNDALGIALGGTGGRPIPFKPMALDDRRGFPDRRNVCVHVALSGLALSLADMDDSPRFESLARQLFAGKADYQVISLLAVPIKNPKGEVIGVLELINARNSRGRVVSFATDNVRLIEGLASQLALAEASLAMA